MKKVTTGWGVPSARNTSRKIPIATKRAEKRNGRRRPKYADVATAKNLGTTGRRARR